MAGDKSIIDAQERMTRVYDRIMSRDEIKLYYADSGFFNFGYWDTGATTQAAASEALIDQLVARIRNKEGRILDVACGLGASTMRLMLTYTPEMITAINISEAQIVQGRQRAPGASFRRMDATRLEFPDARFDAVMCVEAAFHFNTRDAFLREAFRVLKPGGALVMSDMIFRRFVHRSQPNAFPIANDVPDTAGYKRRLADAGFGDIDVSDETEACMSKFRHHLVHFHASLHRGGQISLAQKLAGSAKCRIVSGYYGAATKAYLLVSATKSAVAARPK